LLSIGVVTFNSERTIKKTLDSIVYSLPQRFSTRLVVIDNGSIDGTIGIIQNYAHRYRHVRLFRNKENIGFARAHNQALTDCDSRYHVICNPDIVLSTDVFTPFVDFMEDQPEIGMSCPKFFNPDGTIQHLNRRPPTVLDLLLRRLIPEAGKSFLKKRLESYDMRDVGYDISCDVPFVSGAFMFCRTRVLKEVGGFDERFFLYFEDADLSRRVQNHGYRTVYFPEVCVTHVWERLAHKNWRGSLMFIKSAYKYFRKWGFKWW
jgi:GT2 family glycosyltransferase